MNNFKMNKSTPISQLPSTGMDDVYVSGQQSQQRGLPMMPPPDNEDDPAIQEVMSQLEGSGPSMMPMMQSQQPIQQPQYNYAPSMQNYSSSHMQPFSNNLNKDIQVDNKLLFVIALGAILVQIVPIDQFVSRWVAIGSIPFSGVLIKAGAVAGFVYVVTKFLL
jgi:hypothetical protein